MGVLRRGRGGARRAWNLYHWYAGRTAAVAALANALLGVIVAGEAPCWPWLLAAAWGLIWLAGAASAALTAALRRPRAPRSKAADGGVALAAREQRAGSSGTP